MDIIIIKKKKKELEMKITEAVSDLVDDFKLETGISPCDVNVNMFAVVTMGRGTEWVVSSTECLIRL